MGIGREIKRNKELEKYFLDYLCWSHLLNLIPEERPIDADAMSQELLILNQYEIVSKKLFNKLDELYGLKVRLDNHDDPVNQLIIDVSEFYLEKYGEDAISKMADTKRAKIAEPRMEIMQQMLKIQSNACVECGTERVETQYDRLPPEEQRAFSSVLDQVDYFLYCPKCKAYSMLGKTETVGFND